MNLFRKQEPPLADARHCLHRPSLLERLRMCIDWPIGRTVVDVEVKRLFPGRDLRLELEYAITLESGSRRSSKSIYAVYPALQLEDACFEKAAQLSEHGLTNVFIQDPEWNLTIHSWDRDPTLTQAPRCLDRAFMAARLATLKLPEEGCLNSKYGGDLQCRSMAYRRGKRLVVKYWNPWRDSSRCALVGKSYANNRGERIAARQAHLAQYLMHQTKGRVRVPNVVYYDCDLRMLFTEWAGPPPLPMAEHLQEPWTRQAAEALAAVHATPPDGLDPFGIDDQWEILERWQAVIRSLKPDLAARSDNLMRELLRARRRVSGSKPVVVHRDFYESQMAVGRRTVTVYDLDTLAIGDRCLDVGNYLAHLWLWCLQRGFSAGDYAQYAGTMLDTYESGAGRLDDRSLAFYWASTLYRVGAIHAFRDATSRYTRDMWHLVLPVLKAERKGVLSSAACSA